MKITSFQVAVLCLFAVLFMGCSTSLTENIEQEDQMKSLQLTSLSFQEGELIPARYTCDGTDVSPQIEWTDTPAETQSFVLIADDPDAPVGTWVHWVLYDIPLEIKSLPEGVQGTGTQGKNDFRRLGYGGPCPPKGSTHRYFFKVYALDIKLNLKEGLTKAEVEKAMLGHILAQGQIVGKYRR